MKDEIKEIYLSNLEWTKTHNNMGGVMGNIVFKDNISYEEYQKLFKSSYFILCDKDYITNLQEKVNQYENPDDLTLFYMWLDAKAKDKMKELEDNLYSANQVVNELLDVKEENERLKELCDKYEEEHNTAFKLWTMKMEEMPNYEEFVDYKSRNEKAINILELSSQNKSICTRPETDTIQSALNILKGE